MKPAIVNLSLLLATAVGGRADRQQLWEERTRSVVAVEFTVAAETGAHSGAAYGVMLDPEGDVVLPAGAIDEQVPVAQLRDFRAYAPGDARPQGARFLGTEPVNGFAFVQVAPSLARARAPLAAAPAARLRVGDELWGIGLRARDEDFAPYLLEGYTAFRPALPAPGAVSPAAVAAPGLPVFDAAGRWAGLALGSFGQTYLQFVPGARAGAPVLLVNLEESSALVSAEAAREGWLRLPRRPGGRPLAWTGAYGLGSPPDGAGVVVGAVAADSPADRAGLRAGDTILALGGEALADRRPAAMRGAWLEREVRKHRPGERLELVCAGTDGARRTVTVELAEAPRLPREAERRFLAELGVVVREIVFADIAGGAPPEGAVVAALAPDGPAAAAGVLAGDVIDEVEGGDAPTLASVAGRLAAATRARSLGEVTIRDRHRGAGEQLLHVHWNR